MKSKQKNVEWITSLLNSDKTIYQTLLDRVPDQSDIIRLKKYSIAQQRTLMQ
jgi:hypothetical protein